MICQLGSNENVLHKGTTFVVTMAVLFAVLLAYAPAAQAGTPCTTTNGGNYCPSYQYRTNPSLTGSALSPNVTTNLLDPVSVVNLDLYFTRVTGSYDPQYGATSSPSVISRTIFGAANSNGDWGLWSYAVVGGSKGWDTTSQKMGQIVGSPAWDGGLITVGDDNGVVWAFGYTTGSLAWKYKAKDAILASPSVSLGNNSFDVTGVYVVDVSGNIYRLNGNDGTPAWNNPVASGVLGYLPPLANGGYGSSSISVTSNALFVAGTTTGSAPGVVKKYGTDGSWKWSSTVAQPVSSAPVLNNGAGLVYVQQAINNCYIKCSNLPLLVALNQSDGSPAWTGTNAPSSAQSLFQNQNQPPCPNVEYSWLGAGTPAYDQAQNRVIVVTTLYAYYGSCGYQPGGTGIYSYDASSGGAPQWSAVTPHPITFSSATVANGVVYVGTDDGYILAFDETNGNLLWTSPQANAGDSFRSPPVISFDRIQAVSNNGTLYVYCLPDGSGGCKVSK